MTVVFIVQMFSMIFCTKLGQVMSAIDHLQVDGLIIFQENVHVEGKRRQYPGIQEFRIQEAYPTDDIIASC